MSNDFDALTAAPNNHSLLFENELVRVLDTQVMPGETVPMHVHRFPSVTTLLSWSPFVRRDHNGTVTLDTSQLENPPQVGHTFWSGPLELHTLENVGGTILHLVSVEIKPKG